MATYSNQGRITSWLQLLDRFFLSQLIFTINQAFAAHLNGYFLKTKALLCTDESSTAYNTVTLIVRSWDIEVTLQVMSAHIGVETQRL